MPANILIVEDSEEYQTLLRTTLCAEGHHVTVTGTVADALGTLRVTGVDLVVLDLGLPDVDGIELCKALRRGNDAYVLIVSGRDSDRDKALGLDTGADDYMTKPVSPLELRARVAALLRRPRRSCVTPRPCLVLRRGTREVLTGRGVIELTRIEHALLVALACSVDGLRTRQQLIEAAWGPNYFGGGHALEVHVGNLRRKIDAPGQESTIRTIRGLGYHLEASIGAS